MAYPTTANLKTFLGITVSTYDTPLGYILEAVIAWVESYTSRKFVISGDTTVKFPCQYPYVSNDGLTLILKLKEVVTVTTLTLPDGQVVASTDYWLAPVGDAPYSSINLFAGGSYRFTPNLNNFVEVVGKFGYSEACPDSIFGVIMQISQYFWTLRNTGGGGGSNAAGAAGGKITLNTAQLDEKVMAILDTYRR